MTNLITFTTARGAKIEVEYITSEDNSFGEGVGRIERTRAVNHIEYRVNGKVVHGERTHTAEAGECIKAHIGTRYEGKKAIAQIGYVPVPADKLADLDAMLAACTNAIRAISDESNRADAAYRADYARNTQH